MGHTQHGGTSVVTTSVLTALSGVRSCAEEDNPDTKKLDKFPVEPELGSVC